MPNRELESTFSQVESKRDAIANRVGGQDTQPSYNIVSPLGKGVGTGQTAQDNVTKLKSDAGFRESELQRANQVMQDRLAAGEDVTHQQKYINDINTLQSQIDAQTKTQSDGINTAIDSEIASVRNSGGSGVEARIAQLERERADMMDILTRQAEARKQEAFAGLESAYNTSINSISKSYNDAIMQGEGQKRGVHSDFASRQDDIHANSYAASEQARVMGSKRNIGNSMQMIGMEQGINTNTNKLHSSNAIARDEMLNSINDRINNLMSKRDLDVGMMQSNLALGKAGIEANTASWLADAELGMTQKDNEYLRNYTDMLEGREYQEGQQEKLWNREDAVYDKKRMDSINDSKDLAIFADSLQRGFAEFQSDLNMKELGAKVAAEFTLFQNKNDYTFEQGQREWERQMERNKYEYDVKMDERLAPYTPGTKAYDIAQRESENKWAEFKREAEFAREIQLENMKDKSDFEKLNQAELNEIARKATDVKGTYRNQIGSRTVPEILNPAIQAMGYTLRKRFEKADMNGKIKIYNENINKPNIISAIFNNDPQQEIKFREYFLQWQYDNNIQDKFNK